MDTHASEGPLHALRLGDPRAKPLIFLHGITGSRRYWQARVSHLAGRYRLIIPDLLGFGLSPKPPVDYTVDRFARSVRRLIEAEGLAGRPHDFIGHSLGALISIQYAINHPEEARRLVLINLPRFQSPEQAHRLFWMGSPQYRKLLNEHSVSENIAQMRRSGVDLFLRYAVTFPWGVLADCRKFTMRSLTSTLEHCLLNYRLDDTLPKLAPRPVLLIHGLRDGVAPVDHVAPLPGIYPWMRLETIPSSGHHVFLTHTKRCLRYIEEFLDRNDARDGAENLSRPLTAGVPTRS